MKEFLFGAAAIVIAGAALAQSPVASTAPPSPAPMADRDHVRGEMVAKVQEHFARLDANKDGFLTREEADAGRAAIKERIVERLGERRDPNAVFDRLDANKDGVINREEFAKAREMRVERRIVRKDGAAGDAPKPMRMHRMGGMMMGGHMFDMADANKDGRVSLQEATDAAARHFDMADVNKDGKVTPEERRQMHRQMKDKHRAPTVG